MATAPPFIVKGTRTYAADPASSSPTAVTVRITSGFAVQPVTTIPAGASLLLNGVEFRVAALL